MEKPVQGIAIGTAIAIVAGGASVGVWYDGIKTEQHAQLEMQIEQTGEHAASESYRKSVELELRAIDVELKLLRTIAEDRLLTPDEEDREEYLHELRAILIEAQREQVE